MKKFISLLLSAALLAAPLCAHAWSSPPYKNGDVNHDGVLSIKDATVIQTQIAGIPAQLEADYSVVADTNLDGRVDIMDVTKIQKVLANLETMDEAEKPTQAATTEPSTAQPTQPTTVTSPVIHTEPITAVPTQPATVEPTAPSPKVGSMVKISFTNSEKWQKVCFYPYDSATGTPQKDWPGVQVTNMTKNQFGEEVYSATVDVDKYDRIIFNNGALYQTVNVALSKASSGYYISDSTSRKAMMVGTYASTGADGGTMKKLTLPYPSGYDKKIWIWTPADYNAKSAEKYRTIYMLDGQNLFDDDHSDGYGGWEVTDAVESMMANGGRGVIIVGIDNGNALRDSELTPDLGAVVPSYAKEFSKRAGKQFSDFVVNTVMPYVRKNYNSSPAACDNCIAGSSSGGLEAFYIGIENRDKFGMIGALSPAFLLFGADVWDSYLAKFDLSDAPRLYVYNGNISLDKELYPDVISMNTRLLNLGWSPDRLKLSIEEAGDHNEAWWRNVFPECLAWCLNI